MALGEWDWSEPAICPHSFKCKDGFESFDIGRAPSYVSIASSSLSCLGSILIVLTYCLLKDMRSGAQLIITLLAIADFFTAFGYIVGSVNFLMNFQDEKVDDNCPIFTSICEIQSFITTWSTMSSYCWNFILAFYFFLVLAYGNKKLAIRLIPGYNVAAWIGPLLIALPLLVENKLGYAPYVASNWCYIKDMDYSKGISQKTDTIVFLLVAGKLWEIICYVLILLLYIWIKICVGKTSSQLKRDGDTVSLSKIIRVEKRLLAIPLMYIFLRMWGTTQFFYSLVVSGYIKEGCIPPNIRTGYLVLGILQAIGDSGQGWCNAILYIILSPTIRRKLCGQPCENCLHTTERRLQRWLESNGNDHSNLYKEQAVISEIVNDSLSGGAESDRNQVIDASGYKIQKYYDSTCTTSGMEKCSQSSKGPSLSTKSVVN